MNTKELTQELAPIKSQVSKAVSAATALEIKTADQMTNATDILGKIKTVGKMIKSKKETITKPLNEALRNARAFFAPLEKQFNDAERIVKNKMLDYQRAEMAKATKKTEKIENKVESGKMSFDKAADKIEEVTPEKTVEANLGAVQFRTIKQVIIEDESLLPREYLVPDMVKIKKVALAGVSIAGVKVVDKQVVAGLTK